MSEFRNRRARMTDELAKEIGSSLTRMGSEWLLQDPFSRGDHVRVKNLIEADYQIMLWKGRLQDAIMAVSYIGAMALAFIHLLP